MRKILKSGLVFFKN